MLCPLFDYWRCVEDVLYLQQFCVFLRVTSLKTIIFRDGLSQQISTKKFETLSKSQIVSVWGTDIFPRFADPSSGSLASVEDQKITDKKYAKNISSRPQVPSLNLLGGLQDAFVRELMVKSIRHDKLDEARRMFGGYKIKDSRESLFNTKSVTKFAADGEYSRGIKTPPYLLELKPIFEYDIFGKVIEDSLEGETPVTLRLQFKEKHLYMLKPLLDANLLRKQSKDHLLGLQYKLFQYLLEYGYYTVRDYVSNNAVRVIVPNLEMKSELKRLIYTRKFFVDKFRIEESTLADYLMAIDMLTKNRTSFETLCASVAGIFAHNMPERSFEVQGPLLAYPALCPGAFEEVYSELHSERDRPADVFIRRNDGAAIVIGLTLDGDPFESLKQIIGRGYYKERVERSRRKIYIGVNVDTNNRCLISYLWNSEDLANAENVSFTADVRSHEYGSCPSSTDRLQ
ncbi:uncharacterized protein [Bemisia tabaci]|uniref:uncharacterized protein isoform X2 n=1 Tax=Bemisia tabaci TaxID=7038 RepID=UPI003B27D0A3